MKIYGFGIVGCGLISEKHAAAIADLPNARLAAVTDLRRERAGAFAAAHACEACDTLDDLVARGDVDVVCVCTPSGAHRDPALAAARAGKQVVVEKPLEVTLPRCDEIIDACRANRSTLGVVFPWRFSMAARVLRAAVDEGRFGRITVGDCYNKWHRSQAYYDEGGWHGTWNMDGGGACMNQGIHAIDLAQWLLGPVQSVAAFVGCLVHERIEVEDTAVAAVRYASGALGVIECATSVYPGEMRRIAIHGDRGTAVMEDDALTKWTFADERETDAGIRERLAPSRSKQSGGASDPAAGGHGLHRAQIADFLAALDEGRAPLVDGGEGRKAVAIVRALYASAESGQIVSPDR